MHRLTRLSRLVLSLLLAIGLAVALSSSGCAAGGADDGGASATSTAGALVLDEASVTRVAGTYTHDGITITFDSAETANERRLTVSRRDGGVLLTATQIDRRKSLSILGGKAVFALDTAPAEGAMSIGKVPSADVLDQLQLVGDGDALGALIASPDAAVIAWLSRDLGARGITGFAYPASFEIHSFGLMIARAQGLELPPVADEAIGVSGGREGEGESCSRWPGQDQCMGMCGPGCGCWKWVCGDCCFHKGCDAHDNDCRKCSWSHPGACLRCASFSSFFTGGRCEVW